LLEAARQLAQAMGEKLFEDHNLFRARFDETAKESGIKLSAADRKAIINAVSWRVETAPPVIASVHKLGKVEVDPIHGHYAATIDGKPVVVEYEADSELRDSEQVPLLENGGIEAFFRREVLPYVSDAWIDKEATKIGYEISFTRYFYKPPQLRSLDTIRQDIALLERESGGLVAEIIGKRD
jgi:type I restriction enzyme M protein